MSLDSLWEDPEPEEQPAVTWWTGPLPPEPEYPADGWTPLPEDFPVKWDARPQGEQEIIEALSHLGECPHGEDCAIYAKDKRAAAVYRGVMPAIEVLCSAAEAMWKHGDELAAIELSVAVNRLAEGALKPYLRSAGLDIPE